MVAIRTHLGVELPALPPRQTVLALAPSAAMPRGYELRDEGGSLQLVRIGDGARLGVMASAEFACDFAATLARIEEQRRRMEEAAA